MKQLSPHLLLVTFEGETAKIPTILKALHGEDVLYTNEQTLTNTWHVDNKYFSCDVQICACMAKQTSEIKQNNSVEAIVIIFDSDVSESRESLAVMHEMFEADLFLVYDIGCNKACREEVLSWCVEQQAELIFDNADECKENYGFQEMFGVERVAEALNSHVWSDHTIKTPEKGDNTANGNIEHSDKQNSATGGTLQEESLEKLLNSDASFEEMFGKFQSMKNTAQTLPWEERREYAENVTRDFMQSMGINDSSDEEQ